MSITFRCPSCGSQFTVDAQLAGRTGRCKKCGHRIVIPTVSTTPAKTARQGEPVAASVRRFVSVSEPADNRRSVTSGHSDRSPRERQSTEPGLWSFSRVALKPISDDQIPDFHDEASLHASGPAHASLAAARDRPATWQDAVNSTVRLKPIPVERVPALQRLIKEEDDGLEEDSTPYHLAREIPPDERPKRSGRPPGMVATSYHGLFRKSARILRFINESAYGISILFLMVACVGFAMQVYENRQTSEPDPPKQSSPARSLGQIETDLAQSDLPAAQEQQAPAADGEVTQSAPNHKATGIKQSKWTIIGVTGIVVLNLVRLIVGLANLVVIPFEKSPLAGVLFLIPPITFVHIWRHWNKLRNPVRRVIGPAVALGLVVLAYAFVPGLSRASRTTGGLERRLEKTVGILKGDVTRQVDQTTNDAQTLKAKVERRLPDDLERAKATAKKIGNEAQNEAAALKRNLPAKVDQIQKAGENARDRVQKSVDEITSPKQNEPEPSQSSAPSTSKTPSQQSP